jgi:rhamnosyltransferase
MAIDTGSRNQTQKGTTPPSVTQRPIVSIIIRNRNEAVYLRQVLAALSVQDGPPREVIVVDNASTDESVDIALSYGSVIVDVPESEFTYGRGLNVGLRAATGEICVILSAHSLPAGKHFISACVDALSGPEIAAARCVYAGKSSDMIRWTSPELLDGTATLDDIISKGPLGSGCVIRRSVWLNIPFDESISTAEDKLWAAAVLNAGYKIVSPCDAFYFYIKPLSPSTSLRYNYRDLGAICDATGHRFGAAGVTTSKTILNALWAITTGVPRAALSIIGKEATRIRLRLEFPRSRRENITRRLTKSTEEEPRTLAGIVGKRLPGHRATEFPHSCNTLPTGGSAGSI